MLADQVQGLAWSVPPWKTAWEFYGCHQDNKYASIQIVMCKTCITVRCIGYCNLYFVEKRQAAYMKNSLFLSNMSGDRSYVLVSPMLSWLTLMDLVVFIYISGPSSHLSHSLQCTLCHQCRQETGLGHACYVTISRSDRGWWSCC